MATARDQTKSVLDIGTRTSRALVSYAWRRNAMFKNLAGLAAICLIVTLSTYANAGCACQCINGQIVPACTNSFEVPPICPLRTCLFGPSLTPPPIGGRSSCGQVQSCDTSGHCTWKYTCR